VRMYLPTALFVGCLVALNYILPHGSGTGSTGRKSSESVANRRTAVRHGSRPVLAGSEAEPNKVGYDAGVGVERITERHAMCGSSTTRGLRTRSGINRGRTPSDWPRPMGSRSSFADERMCLELLDLNLEQGV
jgi:hypothetical protein